MLDSLDVMLRSWNGFLSLELVANVFLELFFFFFCNESVISYEDGQDHYDSKTGYLLVRLKKLCYCETQSHFFFYQQTSTACSYDDFQASCSSHLKSCNQCTLARNLCASKHLDLVIITCILTAISQQNITDLWYCQTGLLPQTKVCLMLN